MIREIKGDIAELVPKVNILSDRLAWFKKNNKDFNYKIKLTIGKVSKLCLFTEKMNTLENLSKK